METHWNYTDELFEKEFALGTFPSEAFSHEAHLRLAFIHLKKYGKERAVQHITAQLKAYTRILKAEGKYHETLTIASIYIVNHFSEKIKQGDFKTLLNAFPRLKTNFKELLFQHYSEGIILKDTAKQMYLAPDLLPFP